MREILFRAKAKDNGKWLEGFPVRIYDYGGLVWEMHPFNTNFEITRYIDPKTIGQFTGLTDKNSKKIFEGDILKFSDCGIYPVWWDSDFCTFGSCWFSDFDPLYKYDRQKIEIIGNIHDNPELLEVQE